MNNKNLGTVWLVGFGPGDPDLLTIKALRALENADAILYDSLTNEKYLNEFPAEKVFVGKRRDLHSKAQGEINELLYEYAKIKKNTVRIKGGDPMIFGRGGEEERYLASRGVEVKIIPGVSSSVAAAASIGIPLTQRGISSSVSFCSGHHHDQIKVPDTDTLVYYMCAKNIKIIAQKALEKGREPETPVALIHNISLPGEWVHITTLSQLKDSDTEYPTPLLAIIGNTIDRKILGY